MQTKHAAHTPNAARVRSILRSFAIPKPLKKLAQDIAVRAYDHGMINYQYAVSHACEAKQELAQAKRELADAKQYIDELEWRLDGAYRHQNLTQF